MKSSSESSIWKVEYPDDFADYLKRRFSRDVQAKIIRKIEELIPLQNPLMHPQVIPLTEERLRGKYRMKFGRIRVVFSLNSRERILLIELVALRQKDTYRRVR